MQIHFASPYSLEGNLGQAYNKAVSCLAPEDWMCLLDLDVMLLGEAVGHQLAHIIGKYPEIGLFTCYTNRVGRKVQRYGGMWRNADLRAHRLVSLELQEKHYDEIELINAKVSGHLMLFSKNTWETVGGFANNGILGVDYDFSERIVRAGCKIALMKGVYATHYYRLLEGKRHTAHLKMKKSCFREKNRTLSGCEKAQKVLVVIANYGTTQLHYLQQVIDRYKSFDISLFCIDIVIHSNIPLTIQGADVRVLTLEDYDFLPFSCRDTIWQRRNDYDVFIYSENDILVTQENLEAYLKASRVLPLPLIPGFILYEKSGNEVFYPQTHQTYRLDKNFVYKIEDYAFVYLNNEHSAMFCLTAEQLRYISTKLDFTAPLRDPMYERNTLKVQCCTGVYNLAGLRKVIAASHWQAFSIHHLPDKYAKKWRLAAESVIKPERERILGMDSRMSHTTIIEDLIKKFHYHSYLEVGCDRDANFEAIRLKKKVGVDPKRGGTHRMSSDAFFDANTDRFDIVFIDGLHEEEQVLKDILNALNVLNQGGTVVVHDLLPSSEVMQTVPRRVRQWTGDCWKAWVRLRATRRDLEMFVIDTDYGVGIVREGSQVTLDLPHQFGYADFHRNRALWMNVFTIDDYLTWLSR